MRLRVTSNVDSHRANPYYKCLVVEWNGEPNFRRRGDGSCDWLPTDQELLDLLVEGIKISPTLWFKILEIIKPVTKLHEVLKGVT